jgi:hypothetical protein
LDSRPLLAFLKVRSVTAAAAFSIAGWLYLVLVGPSVTVPFGQRSVPSPLIWPAAAAVSTMLLSCSQLRRWEMRAKRRLWPYRLAALFASVLANLAAVVALAPPFARLSLLTWFATLQAVALTCSIVFGDQAWLPLMAVILVAMFELAQDGSWLLRAVAGSETTSLVTASSALLLLAGIAASDRAARRDRG